MVAWASNGRKKVQMCFGMIDLCGLKIVNCYGYRSGQESEWYHSYGQRWPFSRIYASKHNSNNPIPEWWNQPYIDPTLWESRGKTICFRPLGVYLRNQTASGVHGRGEGFLWRHSQRPNVRWSAPWQWRAFALILIKWHFPLGLLLLGVVPGCIPVTFQIFSQVFPQWGHNTSRYFHDGFIP